ncbi:MAG: peptidyl-prolyl cis-trans isomerase [Opitutaceae bacterium]
MISWIQKTFQQHFRTIFLVLLVLVIVSFVFTIGASPGLGNAGNKALNRPFFGVNLGSKEDQARVFRDASISINLQAGYMALDESQMQNYGLQRFAALHLANELRVPGPTGPELTEFVKTLRAFTGQDGKFDATRYAQFRDSLKIDTSLSEADVARVLADDFRYDRLQKLLAGPGYVMANDVKQQLARAETSWTLAVATADYAKFSPTIDASDAALTKFFEENAFRYEVQPQVQVRVIEFSALNYVSQVKLDESAVRAYYDANPARFPKPATPSADGKPAIQLPATTGSDADYAIVRPQVEASLTLERARALAAKAASDLSLALYESKIPRSGVDAYLTGHKLTAKSVPPFTRNAAAAELGASEEVAAEAFKLNENRYFSDALSTASGSVILLWENLIPTHQPQFVEVKAAVKNDYIENEKRKRFVDVGKTARALIESRLKAGDSFEKAVESAGATTSLTFTTKAIPAFTRREPPADLDGAVSGTLESLEKGGVSDMILSGPQGIVVHVVDKKAPVTDESNPRFVETRGQLARLIASRNAGDYLSDLVEKELAKSAPATR